MITHIRLKSVVFVTVFVIILIINSCQISHAQTCHLEPYTSEYSRNVTQNEFFNFTTGVRCVGGDCGNVTATLDPKRLEYRNPGQNPKHSPQYKPAVTRTEERIYLNYSFAKPITGKIHIKYTGTTQDTITQDTITIPGLYKYGSPGMPVLPFKTAKILIPYGKNINKIDVIPGKRVVLGETFNIESGQKPVPLTSRYSWEPTSPDSTIYTSDREFPAKLYSQATVESMRRYDILLLNIYPVT